MSRSAKLPPGIPSPEQLFRKWSKRTKRGKFKAHRKLGKKALAKLIKIFSEMTEKQKCAADSKVNKYLAAVHRKRLFTFGEFTSKSKQANQAKAIETSERVRARLEAKAAERAAYYEPRPTVNGFGRGPGRGRGPSKPKTIEIDGVAYDFYPAKAVATQLNLSAVNFWVWRQQQILPDYCLIDWRGRRWYPEPYLMYALELGQYRLEMVSAGEKQLWRFKSYAIHLWETRWKAKMPPISGIKMTRNHFLTCDWHRYLPENVKEAASANVSAKGSAFGGAKTGESARRGFKHLRVHAPKGKAPQAPTEHH